MVSPVGFVVVASLVIPAISRGAEKMNYQDHALPIFRNTCLNCHNPDKKKAGLDLSTYQTALAGGDDGPVINPGDPDGSVMYRVLTHQDEPTMPPKRDKLSDKELDLLKRWIAGGALETANGKAAAPKKPKVDLSVVAISNDRPAGPLPMPHGLVIESFVSAPRSGALSALTASPWAPVVAVAGQKQVLLYNPETRELLGIVPFPDGEPQVAAFSRSGQLLLIGGGQAGKSGKVVLWDIVAGRHITDVGDEFDSVLAADLSPDQSVVALGGPGKTVKLYSTKDGQLIQSIAKKHTDWINSIAFSPDGILLASGDRAGGLRVWEARGGNEFYNLAGHKAAVTAVAFRGDSNVLASASEDGTIKLWDMHTGKEARSWAAHPGGALSVAFARDGSLVSCGRDHIVKLWKPDGSPLKQFEPFTDIALHAVFDYDGQRVIAGDWTGEVRVWTVADGKLAGSLTSNPPPLAERIDAAMKRLAQMQGPRDRAAADLDAARNADHEAAKQLETSEASAAAAHAATDAAQGRLTAASAQAHTAADSLKSANELVASRRNDLDHAASTARDAAAALDAAQHEPQSLNDALAAKQKASDAATQAADDAQADTNHPDDAQKLSAAADKAAEELAAAKRAAAEKAAAISSLRESAARAAGEPAKLAGLVDAAKQSVSSQSAAAEHAAQGVRSAEEDLAKARGAEASAASQLGLRRDQAKTKHDSLDTARRAAEQAEAPFAAARSDLAKLRAAQFYLSVFEARRTLDTRQAEQDRLSQAAAEAQAKTAQASAELASAQQRVVDAPGRIKAAEDTVAKAQNASAAAAAEAAQVQTAVDQRVAQYKKAADAAQSLEDAGKSPESRALLDAAVNAKAAVEKTKAELTAAQQACAGKADAAKAAVAGIGAAEALLAKSTSDSIAAPQRIESLRAAAVQAAAELAKRQSVCAEQAKALAAAKANVEQLDRDYQKMTQEAASPAAVPGRT